VSSDSWFIETISLVKATTLPTKEEMEKLSPKPLPQRWEITIVKNIRSVCYQSSPRDESRLRMTMGPNVLRTQTGSGSAQKCGFLTRSSTSEMRDEY
jgi:hypothetical protein